MTPRAEWQLAMRRIGRRVLIFDEVDSTNSRAAAMSSDRNNDGLVILADNQTAGRGQHGRNWQCPRGEGLLLSVLLFPPTPLRRPVLLAAWAAVAICETIRRHSNLQARIKWPNDVLVEGRKICGILIEQSQGVVAGIGLNVNQSTETLSFAGLPMATSLAIQRGQQNRDLVAQLLIYQLDAIYDQMNSGDLELLRRQWIDRLDLLGKFVEVEYHRQSVRGTLMDLDWSQVIINLENGTPLCLQPEHILHLHEVVPDSP